MSQNIVLDVRSEIGKLKTVLLHRPGKEIENITPNLMERLLFDDIPYLEVAAKEHDVFADTFRSNGVEVLYLTDLASEALSDNEVLDSFIDEYLKEARIKSVYKYDMLKDFFKGFDNRKSMIEKMISGIRKSEMPSYASNSLIDLVESKYPFLIDPMPNLYFTRDPFASIANGISLNTMKTVTRNRETIFAKYIFKHHPRFKDSNTPLWYNRGEDSYIEGGDQLVLSNKVLAVGISQRTEAASIEKLARNILGTDAGFETVLAFDIPKTRAFMHLDTVFTMVDHDKFTIHPEIEGPLTVYSITMEEGNLKIAKESMELEDILKKYLGLDDVTLIRCGDRSIIDAAREQWNDGSNTLALSPGEVIVYSRNHVTNRLLEENGVKLHIIPSSELSRGRGGPRCMSMPLIRESII